MLDLKSYLLDKRIQIDAALCLILESAPQPKARIVEAMRYALMSGGKRLRPVLCLAACETVGGFAEQAMPVACALEMIHSYSLIHDDLPAMDDDCLRRGRPTCHIAFDEATAVLAGDALLTLAFETLSSKANIYKIGQKTIPAERWLNIISVISIAAGYKGMVEGQMRDMLAEHQRCLLLSELEELHLLKTGALIEASVCSGALLGQGSSDQVASLKVYAKNIGLAFQVADDILNVEGDPLIMGKGTGTDRHRSKSTYPSLLGLSESKETASRLIGLAIESLKRFDHRADPLRALARYIIERNR
jgi:geranylgeranyl diphosphate synthase, type II